MTKAATIRLIEIAELLEREQATPTRSSTKGFPAPLAEDARGRVWSRYEVQAWARRWQGEKPWR
jgi:hypothetical protein